MQYKPPYVTFLFSCIFVGLFFLPEPLKERLLTSPMEIVYLPSFSALGRAFLSGFMHISLGHLLSNLCLFIMLGYGVEGKIGSRKTFWLLIASGMGALILHVSHLVVSPIPFLGASGFVFGLLAAYCKLLGNEKRWFS